GGGDGEGAEAVAVGYQGAPVRVVERGGRGLAGHEAGPAGIGELEHGGIAHALTPADPATPASSTELRERQGTAAKAECQVPPTKARACLNSALTAPALQPLPDVAVLA